MSLSVLWWAEYLSGFCELLDCISTDNKGSRVTECACTLLNLAMLVFELNPTWRVQNIAVPELVYRNFCCQFSSASTGMSFFDVWFYPEQQVKNVPWVSTNSCQFLICSQQGYSCCCLLFIPGIHRWLFFFFLSLFPLLLSPNTESWNHKNTLVRKDL